MIYVPLLDLINNILTFAILDWKHPVFYYKKLLI